MSAEPFVTDPGVAKHLWDMTLAAVREQRKTVHRERVDAWSGYQLGERLTLVAADMPGSKKGTPLARVEVVRVRIGTLADVTMDELAKEGLIIPESVQDQMQLFGDWCGWWAESYGFRFRKVEGVWAWTDRDGTRHGSLPCRRVEWRYLDGAASC